MIIIRTLSFIFHFKPSAMLACYSRKNNVLFLIFIHLFINIINTLKNVILNLTYLDHLLTIRLFSIKSKTTSAAFATQIIAAKRPHSEKRNGKEDEQIRDADEAQS